MLVEAVADDEGMCHADPMRLHGMTVAVVDVPYLRVVVIRDLSFGVWHGCEALGDTKGATSLLIGGE